MLKGLQELFNTIYDIESPREVVALATASQRQDYVCPLHRAPPSFFRLLCLYTNGAHMRDIRLENPGYLNLEKVRHFNTR